MAAVQYRALENVNLGRNGDGRHPDDRLVTIKEVRFLTRLQHEHIIIEIDEASVKSRNPVQVHLYAGTVEGRQMLLGDEFTMQDDTDGVSVRPVRYLAISGYKKMYIFYKRHILRNAAKQVGECPVIPKTVRCRDAAEFGSIAASPLRILSVDVCDDCVHPIRAAPLLCGLRRNAR